MNNEASEQAEVSSYILSLHESVRCQIQNKPHKKLLRMARKHQMSLPDANRSTEQEQKEHISTKTYQTASNGSDTVQKAKKYKKLLRPSPREIPLPLLVQAESVAANQEDDNKARGFASGMMSHDEAKRIKIATAHFAAASKQLEKKGGGELLALWKKRMHGFSVETQNGYKIHDNPQNILQKRRTEKRNINCISSALL